MEINASDVRINVGKERKEGSEEISPEQKRQGTLDMGFSLSCSHLALTVPRPSLAS